MKKVIELRASNAHRWMVCHGQPQAVAGLIDEASEAADRGTVAHALLEIGLRLGMRQEDLYTYQDRPLLTKVGGRRVDHIVVTEEMIESVSHVLEYVHNYLAEHPEADYDSESEVDASSFVGKPSGGTSDLILHDLPRELVVIDYKNGVQHVDHVDNHQLRIYCLGAIDKYSERINIQTKFRTVIIQPNSREAIGAIRESVYSYDEIIAFAGLAAEAAKEAYKKNPKRVSGEHCSYCRAAGSCKTFADKALHQAALDFALITEADPLLQDAQNMDDEEIAKIVTALPMLKKWIANVEEEAIRRLVHGHDVPRYKLVGSNPHRRWRDIKETVDIISKLAPKALDELAPRKPLSPSAIEKVLPKLVPKNNRLLSLLQGTIIRNPVEPRLALEDDPRLPFKPGEEFK